MSVGSPVDGQENLEGLASTETGHRRGVKAEGLTREQKKLSRQGAAEGMCSRVADEDAGESRMELRWAGGNGRVGLGRVVRDAGGQAGWGGY